MAAPPLAAASSAPSFYRTSKKDLRNEVHNFDQQYGLDEVKKEVKNPNALNFVLNYGRHEAWCVCNVDEDALVEIVQQRPPAEFDSTWIQLWYPHKQKEVIKALASKYGFSPRLAALMQSDPRSAPPPQHQSPSRGKHKSHQKHSKSSDHDAEKANGTVTIQPNSPDVQSNSQQQRGTVQYLNHYDIVSSIWHWSSIDTNKKYFCLGYNSLHNVKPDYEKENEDRHFRPYGDRIWTWLILCNDKTVITITESPRDRLSTHDRTSTSAEKTRENTLNVLNQLSATFHATTINPISIIPIRELLLDGSIDNNGAAGLLFYYLFDDWYSTYGLLAKDGHRYEAELNKIRKKMREKASLDSVDILFCLGRQLAVLKLVYQAYIQLIDKILTRQKDQESKQKEIDQSASTDGSTTTSALGVPIEEQAVDLVAPAQDRFERLRDRITLYVISDIQECINIKDSLLSTNFNLISIKESDAVERLTRITIFLGKATILFLPVSLMSQYFSVNIKGVEYTLTQFWVAFAIIFFVSFCMLFVFGKISSTTEGNMVYEPINRIIGQLFRKYFGIHRWRRQNAE